MDVNRAKDEVILAGNELVSRGLVARTWGNVSCRIDADHFAITPSGISYDRLTPREIVVVDIHTLAHKGDIKPSSEKGIHAAAYELDAAVQFVIHTHQTYATCLSIAGYPSLALSGEEPALLKGGVGLAKYGLPGTKTLKKHVADMLRRGYSAILMEKHGALITGPDRDSAFCRAVALEEACKRATAGLPPLSDGQSADTPTETLQALHTAISQSYPAYQQILHLHSPAVEQAMRQTAVLPAMLDDFAQMVGGDLRRAGGQTPEQAIFDAVRKLRGRNGVYVDGLGLICCAAELTDCEALLTLTEKNALAYLNAARHNTIEPISLLDRKLMRLVYTRKYSKKK